MVFNSGKEAIEQEVVGNIEMHSKNNKEHLTVYCNSDDNKGYYVDLEVT